MKMLQEFNKIAKFDVGCLDNFISTIVKRNFLRWMTRPKDAVIGCTGGFNFFFFWELIFQLLV